MDKQKITGIKVFGILTLLWSAWMVSVALGHILSWEMWHTSRWYNKTLDSLFNLLCLPRGVVDLFFGLKYIFLFLGASFLIAGVNILRFKDWARKAIVYLSAGIHILSGISIIIIFIRSFALMNMFKPQFTPFIFLLMLSFFLPSVLIWHYFSRPEIKQAFGEQSPASSRANEVKPPE